MNQNRLISQEGMEKLRQEWEELFREERPRLLLEIAAAAEQGDRSENAEYIYGKKRLREIDKRLRQLDAKISGSTVVEGNRRLTDSIVFGARVHLKKQDGKEWIVQIVGVDEIDPIEGKISMDSPMGKALMGKSKTASIEVLTPRGPVVYEIMAVDYP
jgi:transcription elongation factor GreB